jgi:hypothetical protein
MAHKSHRKHLKHVHAHEDIKAPHLQPEEYSLRDMAGEVVHAAVDAVKAAPHAIVERVMRKPRALMEKLSGTYAHVRSK